MQFNHNISLTSWCCVGWQAFCVFLFLAAVSLFGTLISQLNEIFASSGTYTRQLHQNFEAYLQLRPRHASLSPSLPLFLLPALTVPPSPSLFHLPVAQLFLIPFRVLIHPDFLSLLPTTSKGSWCSTPLRTSEGRGGGLWSFRKHRFLPYSGVE
jgi:hypothetical protein